MAPYATMYLDKGPRRPAAQRADPQRSDSADPETSVTCQRFGGALLAVGSQRRLVGIHISGAMRELGPPFALYDRDSDAYRALSRGRWP